ncbi:MAG: helix-turn-helix transcriptional regulator [Verrucomicrobia bacterium]|nr:helix-turn-helix transcriptional regulator [Verrucomicrobiota bacterium]
MPTSQLERTSDWALLAERARYRAAELAKLSRVSLRQLERYFIEHFRRPPQDWLDELRLIKAALLLANGHRVKEVAASLGFSDTSHFSKRFERYHGCRPVQFVRIYDRRLAERKKKFAAWFPGEQIPLEWLADPALAKPWDLLFQQQRQSFS